MASDTSITTYHTFDFEHTERLTSNILTNILTSIRRPPRHCSENDVRSLLGASTRKYRESSRRVEVGAFRDLLRRAPGHDHSKDTNSNDNDDNNIDNNSNYNLTILMITILLLVIMILIVLGGRRGMCFTVPQRGDTRNRSLIGD